MPSDDLEIVDIPSLLDCVNKVKSLHKGKTLFFRGQREYFRAITPSVAREGFLPSEDKLFKEYILRNPDEFTDCKTTFEKLVKMQHYRLPTRLLDITTNPLVALFFSVEDNKDSNGKDGDFIIFAIPDEYIKYFDSDTVSVVSNIARRPVDCLTIASITQGVEENDDDFRRRFNKDNGILYLLHEIREEKPYFQDCVEKKHLESIWCVKPLLNNRRIIRQDGAFLLFGINGTKKEIAKYDPAAFKPIRIPVREKKKLRSDLKMLGMSKDKIFPELDTTAEYLRGEYKISKRVVGH